LKNQEEKKKKAGKPEIFFNNFENLVLLTEVVGIRFWAAKVLNKVGSLLKFPYSPLFFPRQRQGLKVLAGKPNFFCLKRIGLDK
jgi:hypothetical protein